MVCFISKFAILYNYQFIKTKNLCLCVPDFLLFSKFATAIRTRRTVSLRTLSIFTTRVPSVCPRMYTWRAQYHTQDSYGRMRHCCFPDVWIKCLATHWAAMCACATAFSRLYAWNGLHNTPDSYVRIHLLTSHVSVLSDSRYYYVTASQKKVNKLSVRANYARCISLEAETNHIKSNVIQIRKVNFHRSFVRRPSGPR